MKPGYLRTRQFVTCLKSLLENVLLVEALLKVLTLISVLPFLTSWRPLETSVDCTFFSSLK